MAMGEQSFPEDELARLGVTAVASDDIARQILDYAEKAAPVAQKSHMPSVSHQEQRDVLARALESSQDIERDRLIRMGIINPFEQAPESTTGDSGPTAASAVASSASTAPAASVPLPLTLPVPLHNDEDSVVDIMDATAAPPPSAVTAAVYDGAETGLAQMDPKTGPRTRRAVAQRRAALAQPASPSPPHARRRTRVAHSVAASASAAPAASATAGGPVSTPPPPPPPPPPPMDSAPVPPAGAAAADRSLGEFYTDRLRRRRPVSFAELDSDGPDAGGSGSSDDRGTGGRLAYTSSDASSGSASERDRAEAAAARAEPVPARRRVRSRAAAEAVPRKRPHTGSSADRSPDTLSDDSVDELALFGGEEDADPLEGTALSDSDGEAAAAAAAPRGRRRPLGEAWRDDGDAALYRRRLARWVPFDPAVDPDVTVCGGLRLPRSVHDRLLPFQRTCLRWLFELHRQRVGGILCDEMGLGKTVQIVCFLAALQHSQLGGPALIACPASVLRQWVREFHDWWPPVRVALLHEVGEWKGARGLLVRTIVREGGILLTTYEGVRVHQAILAAEPWQYVVLDEGHKIRNPDAEITLACKSFRTPHRLILTGAPIQNNLTELWSLFDFVFPGRLGTLPVFQKEFDIPIRLGGYANATLVQVQTAYRCALVLRDLIQPYMLRRMKADVVQLPAKSDQVLFCRLTAEQREAYRAFLRSSDVAEILEGRRRMLPGIAVLRAICNHPGLHTGQGLDDYRQSCKLRVLEQLLPLWRAQGHRALVFSQTRGMLNIVERMVRAIGLTYRRMDGETAIGSRAGLVAEFNSDPGIDVFLLTTKVGGLGLNLTGADRVLLLDPDWNPSTDAQARERAWRIGQIREVTIYRLITSGTIEEKVYQRQVFKQMLTNKILQDPRQRRVFRRTDLSDLFTFNETPEGTETAHLFGHSELPRAHVLGGADEAAAAAASVAAAAAAAADPAAADGAPEASRGHPGGGSGGDPFVGSPVSTGTAVAELDSDAARQSAPAAAAAAAATVAETTGTPAAGDGSGSGASTGVAAGDAVADSTRDDLHVLRALFSGSRLQTVLEHDAVVGGAGEGGFLRKAAEEYAQRMAQRAATALDASRRARSQHPIHEPTWTGLHGRAGRFGTVAAVGAEPSADDAAMVAAAASPTPAAVSAAAAGAGGAVGSLSPGGPLSSAALLARLRSRRTDTPTASPTRAGPAAQAERAVAASPGARAAAPAPTMAALERDVRLFLTQRGGRATTASVVDYFTRRVNAAHMGVFRQALQAVAVLNRAAGVWRLREGGPKG